MPTHKHLLDRVWGEWGGGGLRTIANKLSRRLGRGRRGDQISYLAGHGYVCHSRESEANTIDGHIMGGTESPKVNPEDVVYFGVRDLEEEEYHAMIEHRIRNLSVEEVRFRGLEICVTEALARLDNCDRIYISFDVDSLDCDLISKGTGTPVSKGFDQYEVKEIISGIIRLGKVICLEIVEVNPCLDNKGNKMAETVFDILDHFTEIVEETNLSG